MSELPAVDEMGAFFNARAEGYDDYIRWALTEEGFTAFYQTLSKPIPLTDAPLKVLDLGCGTGLELEHLFDRVPNAQVTGVDLAGDMLTRLRERFADRLPQLTLITGSFLTWPMGTSVWDVILSAMSMHHLMREPKLVLYRKLYAALKPGGVYIEGDSVVPLGMEDEFLDEYYSDIADLPPAENGYYHADIPYSLETQRGLFKQAGFVDFELVWQRDPEAVWNTAVYVGRKL